LVSLEAPTKVGLRDPGWQIGRWIPVSVAVPISVSVSVPISISIPVPVPVPIAGRRPGGVVVGRRVARVSIVTVFAANAAYDENAEH
jgi:hypothetical protein